jgi:hypothetical protein
MNVKEKELLLKLKDINYTFMENLLDCLHENQKNLENNAVTLITKAVIQANNDIYNILFMINELEN